MAQTTLRLPDELLVKLKIYAVKTGTTIQHILQRLVEEELRGKRA